MSEFVDLLFRIAKRYCASFRLALHELVSRSLLRSAVLLHLSTLGTTEQRELPVLNYLCSYRCFVVLGICWRGLVRRSNQYSLSSSFLAVAPNGVWSLASGNGSYVSSKTSNFDPRPADSFVRGGCAIELVDWTWDNLVILDNLWFRVHTWVRK